MRETRSATNTGVGRILSGLAGVIVAAGLVASVTGCQPPYLDALVSPTGQQIRADDIVSILNNTDLTEEEQRGSLRDLGITDERLIDALIRAS